jgi:Tfp pilus assembly protein PilW
VRGRRGTTIAELLVGTALGLAVLAMLTAAVGVAGRMLVAAGTRAETDDTAALAMEALLLDVRRAGWDPTASGLVALVDARADGLGLQADLDGDGAIASDSEESVSWRCAPATRRLSRIVGRQSLPLADHVVGCAFQYLDRGGAPLPTPVAAGELPRVGAVELTLRLLPPGLSHPSSRTTLAGVRAAP